MGKELAKAYEPHEVEERIYEFWMNGKYFHAEVDSKKKPYTIVIPPPNITIAYGTCIGRNFAGYFDSFQKNAGILCFMAAWH